MQAFADAIKQKSSAARQKNKAVGHNGSAQEQHEERNDERQPAAAAEHADAAYSRLIVMYV